MNDENLKNQNNTFHDTAVLEDYEVEIVKKIGFWATLLYRLKNKNIKLLPAGNTKPQKTYKSIHYMWNLGSLKTSLFNTLDNIWQFIYKEKSDTKINSISPQIIGNENNNSKNTTSDIPIIMPKPINPNNKSGQ